MVMHSQNKQCHKHQTQLKEIIIKKNVTTTLVEENKNVTISQQGSDHILFTSIGVFILSIMVSGLHRLVISLAPFQIGL